MARTTAGIDQSGVYKPRVETHGGFSFDLCRTPLSRGSIAYLVGGSGDPLVLLHGLSGSARWWRKNLAALASHSRLYVVDLLGFGYSRGQPFVLNEIGDHLVDWMRQLGLKRVRLMGHSMGGYIAADLAARFPQVIERLVLVDAAAELPHSMVRNSYRLARALRYMPLDFFPVLATDALRAGPYNLLRAGLDLMYTDITPRLGQVSAPTLIVWGEQDQLVPPSVGYDLQRALSGSSLHVIAGAGHNPMWDRPREFNRLVTDFLTGRED